MYVFVSVVFETLGGEAQRRGSVESVFVGMGAVLFEWD